MTVAVDIQTGKVIGQVVRNPRLDLESIGYVRIYTKDGYADKHLVIDGVRLEEVE